MSKFVKTTDSEMAEKLKLLGYQFINFDNGTYVFLNSGIQQFSEENKNKILYTDIISV